MLPRLLFVVGMTIGVMVPLVWAAHVSVPASRAVPEWPRVWGQRDLVRTALREQPKAQSTPRSAPTASSTATAPAAVSDRPEPKSALETVAAPAPASAFLEPEPEQVKQPIVQQAYEAKADPASLASEKAKPAPPDDVTSRNRVDLAPLRESPEVVDLYIANGPHIIIVCSELTGLPKLRMGCP